MDSLRTRLESLRLPDHNIGPGRVVEHNADLDAILASLPPDGEVTRAAEEVLRLEAATLPGPWTAGKAFAQGGRGGGNPTIPINTAKSACGACGKGDGEYLVAWLLESAIGKKEARAAAAFIAYARTALPLLARAILAGQGGPDRLSDLAARLNYASVEEMMSSNGDPPIVAALANAAGQGGLTEEERRVVDAWKKQRVQPTNQTGVMVLALLAIIDRLTGAK